MCNTVQKYGFYFCFVSHIVYVQSPAEKPDDF